MSTETKDPASAIVGQRPARIVVQVAIIAVAIAAAVVALCALTGAFQGENPGPMPDVSPGSPFPADEVAMWVRSARPDLIPYIVLGLLVCGVLTVVALFAEASLTLPADHNDEDFEDHAIAVVTIMVSVLVLAMLVCWQVSPWKRDQPEYQQQANEQFIEWAQGRYGVHLSGLDADAVLDLMDGTQEPLVLDDGRLVGSYESNGNLLLTHGDSADELAVVTARKRRD